MLSAHTAFLVHCLNYDPCPPLPRRLEMPSYRLPWASFLNSGILPSGLVITVWHRTHPKCWGLLPCASTLKETFFFITGSEPLEIHAAKGHIKGSEKIHGNSIYSRAPTISRILFGLKALPLSAIFFNQSYHGCYFFPSNNTLWSNHIIFFWIVLLPDFSVWAAPMKNFKPWFQWLLLPI